METRGIYKKSAYSWLGAFCCLRFPSYSKRSLYIKKVQISICRFYFYSCNMSDPSKKKKKKEGHFPQQMYVITRRESIPSTEAWGGLALPSGIMNSYRGTLLSMLSSLLYMHAHKSIFLFYFSYFLFVTFSHSSSALTFCCLPFILPQWTGGGYIGCLQPIFVKRTGKIGACTRKAQSFNEYAWDSRLYFEKFKSVIILQRKMRPTSRQSKRQACSQKTELAMKATCGAIF